VGEHYLILAWQNGTDQVRYGENPLAPETAPELLGGAWIAWPR